MSKNSENEEVIVELTISDTDSEMIVKLMRIIQSSSHKLPTT